MKSNQPTFSHMNATPDFIKKSRWNNKEIQPFSLSWKNSAYDVSFYGIMDLSCDLWAKSL